MKRMIIIVGMNADLNNNQKTKTMNTNQEPVVDLNWILIDSFRFQKEYESLNDYQKQCIKEAMREACRQLLEIVAEKAQIEKVKYCSTDWWPTKPIIVKSSITECIKYLK